MEIKYLYFQIAFVASTFSYAYGDVMHDIWAERSQAANYAPPYSIEVRSLEVGPAAEGAREPSPIPIAQPMPEYPLEMRRQGVSGYARVIVTILESGEVGPVASESGSHRSFERAAEAVIRRWKFHELKQLSDSKGVVMQFTFIFKTGGDETE